MKINYVGVVAGIIAFISLALPWWTMSTELWGAKVSAGLSVYPYQAKAEALGVPQSVTLELWFGWAALAFIVIAGVVAIAGSLIIGKDGKIFLVVAGILALLSVIVFAAGLQGELSKGAPVSGYPEVGLFSSGSWNFRGVLPMDYSTYLSFGFWLALVAAIIAFVSLLKHPMAAPAAPPTKES